MTPATLNSDEKTQQTHEILNLRKDQIYTFAEGIPGFEKVKQYCLLAHPEEVPFLHLTATGGYNLEFIAVNAYTVLPAYKPEIGKEDVAAIGSPKTEELLVLAIVIVGNPLSETTANLAAPVIINARTGQGRQVALMNIQDYSSKHLIVQGE